MEEMPAGEIHIQVHPVFDENGELQGFLLVIGQVVEYPTDNGEGRTEPTAEEAELLARWAAS